MKKAVEFGVKQERMRNLAKLEAMKFEQDQGRNELAEEKEKNTRLAKELEKLKLT